MTVKGETINNLNSGNRTDIRISNLSLSGDIVIDVSIINPAQAEGIKGTLNKLIFGLDPESVTSNCNRNLHMNEHIEKAKCMKHMKEMHNGDKFYPFIADITGQLGAKANDVIKLISKLSNCPADTLHWQQKRLKDRIIYACNLRCAIARCNAEKFKCQYHPIDPTLHAGTLPAIPEDIIDDIVADLDDDLVHLD